jgi:hypothetical protein
MRPRLEATLRHPDLIILAAAIWEARRLLREQSHAGQGEGSLVDALDVLNSPEVRVVLDRIRDEDSELTSA